VLVNWCTVGHFSGYDATHESSGFSIDNAVRKWDFTIYQLYVFGLFLFAPLGIAGLILMFESERRPALLLALWFVPGALLYTAYYWGDNLQGLAFLRFFLTLFPPLIIAAMFVLKSTQIHGDKRSSIAPALAAGVLTAVTVAVSVHATLGELERQQRGNLNLHYSARQVLAQVRLTKSAGGGKRPMILADSGMFPQFLSYMQFMLDADWYAGDAFTPRVGGGFGMAGFFQRAKADSSSNAPVLLQQERIDYIDSVRRGKTDADYTHDEQRLMDQALNDSRKVYAILSPPEAAVFRSRYITAGHEMVELGRWTEPCAIHYPEPGERDWLAAPAWGDSSILPWHAQVRVMFEIRRTSGT
jgi:hypothetical protein